jgi:hypothetical protein
MINQLFDLRPKVYSPLRTPYTRGVAKTFPLRTITAWIGIEGLHTLFFEMGFLEFGFMQTELEQLVQLYSYS